MAGNGTRGKDGRGAPVAGAAERREAVRNVRRAVVLSFVVLGVGTAGYMLLEGWGFLDALYMTVITAATVGYGEVRELDASGRVWSMAVIVGGIGAIGYVASSVAGLVVEGTVGGYFGRRRVQRAIDGLEGHYVLCGFGRVGREIAQELAKEGAPFVLVDRETANVEECAGRGYLALAGDASEDEVLEAAGVGRAKGLVTAVASDAENMAVVLCARELNPGLRIVARAESDESIRKLKRAGADRTLSPYAVGGRQLARLTVRPLIADFVDVVTHSQGGLQFHLEEFEVTDGSPLANRTIGELRAAERSGARILAVSTGNKGFNTKPSEGDELLPGDTLIVLGTRDQVARMERLVEDQG